MVERVSLTEILPKLSAAEDRGSHWTALCPLHAEPVKLALKEDGLGLRLKCAEGCRFDWIIGKLFPGRFEPISWIDCAAASPFIREKSLSHGIRQLIPAMLEEIALRLDSLEPQEEWLL